MEENEEQLKSDATEHQEIITDARRNQLIIHRSAETAIVISGKQEKLCEMSAWQADMALLTTKERKTTFLDERLFKLGLPLHSTYTAPRHFIPALCGVEEPDTEIITVSRAIGRFMPNTMTDPQGNVVAFPKIYENRDAKARVLDPEGTLLCEADKKAALALDIATPQAHLRNKALLQSYTFEAEPGAIPNLCKKPNTLSK